MSITRDTKSLLVGYQASMHSELQAILRWWQQHAPDNVQGGFWGKISNHNQPQPDADKGVVLHARILWTFSAAVACTHNKAYMGMADRAYHYLVSHFKDNAFGGVYWSVNYKGNMCESRKQVYGLAFTLYGLSQYYAASGNSAALHFAKELYSTIEQHSFDTVHNGYREAFERNWHPLKDQRLSTKDVNASKTMNTHLHIIEAYTSLYKVWKEEEVKEKISNLLFLFDQYFIVKNSGHLLLFFDDAWNLQPDVISYGHDIEAAWLLLQCAEVIGDENWIQVYSRHALSMANAALEGLDKDGGLWYEYEPQHAKLVKQKHWWPQAEAMIGFLNAWQLSGNDKYLHNSISTWAFVEQYLLDKEGGEWFWGVDENYNILRGEDKAGFWKCPYHNARACMEIISRINKIQRHPSE